MPAYSSAIYTFNKDSLTPDFMEKAYESLFVDGAAFKKVFAWGCPPNMTLIDVTHWNQAKIDDDFRLGFSDDVSLNYRQILLSGTPFSESRVFINNCDDSITLNYIFPESEVSVESLAFVRTVSESAWNRMRPELIQTASELDEPISLTEFRDGEPPVFQYFGFVRSKPAGSELQAYDVQALERGYLLQPQRN